MKIFEIVSIYLAQIEETIQIAKEGGAYGFLAFTMLYALRTIRSTSADAIIVHEKARASAEKTLSAEREAMNVERLAWQQRETFLLSQISKSNYNGPSGSP